MSALAAAQIVAARVLSPVHRAAASRHFRPMAKCADTATSVGPKQAYRPALIRMSDVKREAMRWLWHGYIPLGTITIIDGDPGLGKSLITVDLAARVSRGLMMPDGSPSDIEGPADAIIVFCEDDAAATVGPRLDLAGAETTRVHQLEGTHEPGKDGVRPFSLADVAILEAAIVATGARLVTVDPWAAYIGGRDAHRDEKMRELLTPLADLARRHGVAIVIVRHIRKAAGAAVTAGAGAMGIAGAARSVLLVAKDPEDPESRVLAVSKGNLAASAKSLGFGVESRPARLPDGNGVMHDVDVPVLAWGGAVEFTADDLMAAARPEHARQEDGEDGRAGESAEEWIIERLARDPMPARALEDAGRAAGYTPGTFQKARARLKRDRRVWSLQVARTWWWGLGPKPEEGWTAASSLTSAVTSPIA